MSDRTLPEGFSGRITDIYGEAGDRWLANLPELVAEFAGRWSLTLGPVFEPLSYNYVCAARRSDGTPVVLKAGFPDPENLMEGDALRWYNGRGSVRLLESERERGVVLLERLEPGTPLTGLDDEQATLIAARVMRRLWRPLPAGHSFRSLASWTSGLSGLRERFEGRTGPFPAMLVETSERLIAELNASASECVLLHADLHHDNILMAQREPWLAIDPKGIAGDPAYETVAFLNNPRKRFEHAPIPPRLAARRIALLSDELGIDRARIHRWGIAGTVLSAWWTLEGHGRGWEPTIALAEAIAAAKV